jgi:hypothetical protein
MANEKLIQINSAIKPYSKMFIYEKLKEVENKYNKNNTILNKRQVSELNFYLQAYILEGNPPLEVKKQINICKSRNDKNSFAWNPLGYLHKDSVFSFALKPIYGLEYSVNENGGNFHNWGGGEMYGYVGKHLSFYGSLRDNNEDMNLIRPEYYTLREGVPVKNFGAEGVDYSETRGGMMYNWKWGSVGIIKDHVQWGEGYHGTNIQSAHAPSFAMITLNINPAWWFDFNYYHGWLVSQVVDTANSYWTNGVYRVVYFPKYIAANMFTFYPIHNLNISIGNSIVYSDVGGGGPHLAYLIPFLFYKSVDHTLNATNSDGESGQNAQMYLSIGSRNIKHLHMYFTLFADDFSVRHITIKDQLNYLSYKAGFRLSNFPLTNVAFTFEWTRTNPYVYQHAIETTTYESNKYNMGHYLRDNSREFYFALSYKPLRGLHFMTSYTLAQHGTDADYVECKLDPNCNSHEHPFMDRVIWEDQQIDFSARYEIVANTYLFLTYRFSNITGDQEAVEKYTPSYYHGKTNTFTFGANIGF